MESRGFYPSRQFFNYDVTNDRCCNNPHCSSYNYDVSNSCHDSHPMTCNNLRRDNRIHYSFPRREIPKYENRPHHVTEHVTSSRVDGENLKVESCRYNQRNEPQFKYRYKSINNLKQDDRTDIRFNFVY